MSGFNLEAFMAHRFGGHGGTVGITYHGKHDDWVELALPYDARLIGDVDSGVPTTVACARAPSSRM